MESASDTAENDFDFAVTVFHVAEWKYGVPERLSDAVKNGFNSARRPLLQLKSGIEEAETILHVAEYETDGMEFAFDAVKNGFDAAVNIFRIAQWNSDAPERRFGIPENAFGPTENVFNGAGSALRIMANDSDRHFLSVAIRNLPIEISRKIFTREEQTLRSAESPSL